MDLANSINEEARLWEMRNNRETILNYFDNRTTNASAESFNARIKLFRANQKGVRDTKFFLFRITKLYA